MYSTGLTDEGPSLSTLRALLKVRRLAASSTSKWREDETTVFGGSCSERAGGSRFGLQLSFLCGNLLSGWVGPTALDGQVRRFRLLECRKTTVFMASSAHQSLGSEAGTDPLQRLRSVGPIIRPVLRGTERKLATGQYITVALGRSPSWGCSSIRQLWWCLSQVTTTVRHFKWATGN